MTVFTSKTQSAIDDSSYDLRGVDLSGLKTVLILFLSRMIVLNGTNDFDMMFRLCDFFYFGAFLCC